MSRAYYTDAQQRRILQLIPDLIRGRELLFYLVSKELRISYRYAVIGFFWALLEPLSMCLVLTFVFSVVFPLRSLDSTIQSQWEFAGLLLTALIPWQFFSNGLSKGAYSLEYYHHLVGKACFPREFVPLSAVGVAVFKFLMGFVVLLTLLAVFGYQPGPGLIWVPVVFAVQLVLVTGLALLFSSLHVNYRDIGYLVEVGLMFGFYATPIFYTLRTVQEAVKSARLEGFEWLYSVYMFNPMVGLITAYREALMYNRAPSIPLLLWPAVFAAISLVVGVFVFRRRAGNISDYL